MSIECAKLMRSLLKIEAAAAQDSGIAVYDEKDGSDIVLRISIAYLGDIHISRRGCVSKVYSDEAARFKHSRNSGLDGEASIGAPPGQSSGVNISKLPDGNQQQIWDVSNPSADQGKG
ncbi:hypothetical protein K432DRAFT_473488, partial [Lepidopterella palustris CBS 459.81]